jgi:hypothetical protein
MEKKDKKKKVVKKKSKNNSKHSIKTHLKEDIQKLSDDWDDIMESKKLVKDSDFLSQLAEDIRGLDDDIVQLEEFDDMKDLTQSLQDILEKPSHNNFTNTSLIDAAISFQYQDPLNSDLCHLMNNFSHYSTEFDNDYLTVFWSLMEKLERKK